MANTMRWRYGDTNPVMMAVDPDTVIEIGDLLIESSGKALPAASIDTGDGPDNRVAIHDNFAGVAMQQSRAGDAAPIRVATTGVFEFPIDEQTVEVGELLGAKATDDGSESQRLQIVTNLNQAIGRCAKRADDASTVLVDIVSSLLKGGPQAVL